MSNEIQVVQNALDNTIQSDVKLPPDQAAGFNFFTMLARSGDMIAPWWSSTRDIQLRRLWKTSDHLSGAMYTTIAKISTIPMRIVPKDMSIKSHVKLAEDYTNIIHVTAQYGEGWAKFYQMILEDLFGQDNGFFAEIIGEGPKDGPITGMPISISHLDASRSWRTRNPMFPVIYNDIGGSSYKLHYSRVMYSSQMPSADARMNGVGFCACSRAINSAQNLIDIGIYKQEKMGSRPQRELFITQGGLDPEDLAMAINTANEVMDMQGLTRFAKSIAVGDRNIPMADVKSIPLSGLPDGFNEKESTILGMAVLSMAFGIDARELFPGMESGATKADAIIQHIKQRGKSVGQTIELIERQFGHKYLPQFLKMVFDYQDEAQDRDNADISSVRGQARERDLKNRVTTPRIERQKMVEHGELSKAQFEELELGDGRLDDGTDVDILFHIPQYDEFLSGVTQDNFEDKIDEIMEFIGTSRDAEKIRMARQSVAAIRYKFDPTPLVDDIASANIDDTTKVDTSYQQERFGRKLPTPATHVPNEVQNYEGRP
jgi:hypothetical protein